MNQNLNITQLKQAIQQEIEKEKEAHPLIHRYQDAQGRWHVFRTNIYDWKGAIPVVSSIGNKVKIDWVEPGPAWQSLITTKQVVFDPELGYYVHIDVYNRLHPKNQVIQPDLSPKTIEKLNELNEKADSSDKEQPRIAVKRPWGVEYWKPDLVKKALAEGHLQKSDVLGAVPSTFVVRKNGKIVRETPAVFFKEHPELNPFKPKPKATNKSEKNPQTEKRTAEERTTEKPKELPKEDLNEIKQEYIRSIEKALGVKIDDLPDNIRKKLLNAIDEKIHGENVKIEIAGITLPDLSKIEPVPNQKSKKQSIEDEIAKRQVELEYEGDQTSNVIGRLEIGAELAGLGFAAGVINVGKSFVKLGEEAVHNPIQAGKDLVFGTIDWFKSIPEKLKLGFTESPFYAGELAGEVATGEIIGEGIKAATEIAPRPAFAKLSVLEGGGAEPKLSTVRYGITIQALDKPLLTIAKTDEGIRIGRILPAPKEAIEGKTITAYSKLETEFFKRTVEEHAKSPEHAEIFKLGHEIATKIYKTKEPVVKPEEFEVISEHIPEKARPAVKEAIVKYKGDIEVYGSVAQKLQMGEYMTRQPKDIEVVVDNPEKFVSKLEENLKSAGVEYKVEGSPEKPKIYFKVGEEWVKGIEIFSKKSKEGYLGLRGLFSKRSDIAYGFNRQKPIEAEGVEMLRLSEQAARKLEGGHVFKEGDIVPKHEGRWKDVNDLIEIGTAYALEKGLPIEDQLVEYAKLQTKLHGEFIDGIAKFIAEEGRLPTPEEVAKIAEKYGLSEENVKDLLFKREHSSILSSISSELFDASSFLRIPKEEYSIRLESSKPEISSKIGSNLESSRNVVIRSNQPSSTPKKRRSKGGSTPSKKKPVRSKPSPPSLKSPNVEIPSLRLPPPSNPSGSSPPSSRPPSSYKPPSVLPSVEIPEIAVPPAKTPNPPSVGVKRRGRQQSKSRRGKAEWNIYNVFGDPLRAATSVDRAVDKLAKEFLRG